MGSSLCPPRPQIQLIHLSQLEPIMNLQIQRIPGQDIRDTVGSYIGPKTSLVLGCKSEQRRNLFNKYILTYMFFIKNQNNTLGLDISKTDLADIEINDFTKLLILADKHNEFREEILFFQQNYLSKRFSKGKADLLISEHFKNQFLCSIIQKFPIYSTDPTILGYVRRPIIDLHNRIAAKYKDQPKQKEIYCVVQIPKEEETLIKNMAFNKDHLTFSTFIRCFSSDQKARARLRDLKKHGNQLRASNRTNKQISTIFLNISIQQKLAEDYDYGFYQDDSQKDNPFGDIIMNIFNFFEVTGARPNQQEYDLAYGSLAKMIDMRRNRELNGNPELLKVMDVIEGQCEEIKTHSSLIRYIADRNLSITASKSLKASELGEKASGQESINLIEAYLEDRQFDKALQQCEGKGSLEFKVRKAQILYEANRQNEAEQILKGISKDNKKLLMKDHFKEYVLCEFILSKLKRRKGQVSQGKSILEGLKENMKKQYKGKYEFRGRELQRELESYNSQGSMIHMNWQRYCQGLNIGVLTTR